MVSIEFDENDVKSIFGEDDTYYFRDVFDKVMYQARGKLYAMLMEMVDKGELDLLYDKRYRSEIDQMMFRTKFDVKKFCKEDIERMVENAKINH